MKEKGDIKVRELSPQNTMIISWNWFFWVSMLPEANKYKNNENVGSGASILF